MQAVASLTEQAPRSRGLVVGVTVAVVASLLLLAGLLLAVRLSTAAGPPIRSHDPAITSLVEQAEQ